MENRINKIADHIKQSLISSKYESIKKKILDNINNISPTLNERMITFLQTAAKETINKKDSKNLINAANKMQKAIKMQNEMIKLLSDVKSTLQQNIEFK